MIRALAACLTVVGLLLAVASGKASLTLLGLALLVGGAYLKLQYDEWLDHR